MMINITHYNSNGDKIGTASFINSDRERIDSYINGLIRNGYIVKEDHGQEGMFANE